MYSLKHTAYAIICCSFFVVSCGQDGNTEKTSATNTSSQATTCYSYEVKGDLTVAQLSQDQDKVTGYYAWIPAEKDSGRGSVTGTIKGNQINAQYIYLIEGAVQTEEVIFKLEGDTLTQGRGELVDKADGVLAIKDPTKLTWQDPMQKVDCKMVKGAIDDTMLAVEEIKKAK
jgi:hypothetical protein